MERETCIYKFEWAISQFCKKLTTWLILKNYSLVKNYSRSKPRKDVALFEIPIPKSKIMEEFQTLRSKTYAQSSRSADPNSKDKLEFVIQKLKVIKKVSFKNLELNFRLIAQLSILKKKKFRRKYFDSGKLRHYRKLNQERTSCRLFDWKQMKSFQCNREFTLWLETIVFSLTNQNM